jgi:hypothetical protein
VAGYTIEWYLNNAALTSADFKELEEWLNLNDMDLEHFQMLNNRRLLYYKEKYALDEKIEKQIEIIKESNLFNEVFYLNKYPDVKSAGINPIKHYLLYGSKEFRNPSKEFDTKFYLEQYDDVKNSQINPLLHYIRFGRDEKRKIIF